MGKRIVTFLFDFIKVNAFAKLQIILSTSKIYYAYFLLNNRFGHNILKYTEHNAGWLFKH